MKGGFESIQLISFKLNQVLTYSLDKIQIVFYLEKQHSYHKLAVRFYNFYIILEF